MTTITENMLAGLAVEKVKDRLATVNILVYGEPGVGKTQLAGSADAVPEMRPVLLIDVEGGDFTLRHSYPEVDVVRVKTWNDMQNVYNELHSGRTPYRTVILDSLTEIQKFSMYNIMAGVVAKHEDRDPDIASMHEWGKNIEQIRRLVRGFRDLSNINVIMTALAVSDANKKTGVITKKPALSGKLSNEVAGFLDIVLYMYTKEIGGELCRMLLTGTTDEYIAKDRSGKLPLVVQNPTMKELYPLITNTETSI